MVGFVSAIPWVCALVANLTVPKYWDCSGKRGILGATLLFVAGIGVAASATGNPVIGIVGLCVGSVGEFRRTDLLDAAGPIFERVWLRLVRSASLTRSATWADFCPEFSGMGRGRLFTVRLPAYTYWPPAPLRSGPLLDFHCLGIGHEYQKTFAGPILISARTTPATCRCCGYHPPGFHHWRMGLSAVLQCPYCSSPTCSFQSAVLPSTVSTIEIWLMALVALAPCQCLMPGGIQTTTSPGLMSRLSPPHS